MKEIKQSSHQPTLFGVAQDHREVSLSLDHKFILRPHSTFIFQMSDDDSMSPYLQARDYLLVDRAITPYHQCLVIVDIDGERCCRLWLEGGEGKSLSTLESNQKKILLKDRDDIAIEIFGVVTVIFRENPWGLIHYLEGR